MSVLHSQYHACWCFGYFRSRGISRHGIDPQSRNILSLASGLKQNDWHFADNIYKCIFITENFWIKIQILPLKKYIWKYQQQNAENLSQTQCVKQTGVASVVEMKK